MKRPPMFLLENVVGLVRIHWDTFYEILMLLTEGLGNSYLVEWKVLDCNEYGNIPQHRERVFIIGILRSRQSSPLVWPNRSVPQADVTEFLDSDSEQEEIRWPKQITYRRNLTRAIENIVTATGLDPLKHHFFVDVGCSASRKPSHSDCGWWFFSKQLLHNETMISQVQSSISFQVLFKMKLLLSNCPADIQWRGMKLLLSNCPKGKILLPLILTFRFPSRSPRGYMLDVCPCLTRSRAGSGGYWMTWKNRFMNTQEILRLMGVLNIHEMEGVVRPRSLRLIAGNAIPIPLVARVLRSMLNSVSL